jgi:hypothetical protein
MRSAFIMALVLATLGLARAEEPGVPTPASSFEEWYGTPESCTAKNQEIAKNLPRVEALYGVPAGTFSLSVEYRERCAGSGDDEHCWLVCDGEFRSKSKAYRMYRIRGEKHRYDTDLPLCEQDALKYASHPASIVSVVRPVGGFPHAKCAGYAYQVLPRNEP